MKKLGWRTGFFLIILSLVLVDKEGLTKLFLLKLLGIELYKLVWLGIIIGLTRCLFPFKNENMSSGKRWGRNFVKSNNLIIIEGIARQSTIKAFKAQWLYLSILTIYFGVFYFFKPSVWWAIVFTAGAGVMDAVCITLWCPYRNWLVKNKCCNNCRIFNWGFIMAALPLMAIPSFWSYSIVVVCLAIFFQWEYLHWQHPERFYEISNANLQCGNCPGKTGLCRKDSRRLLKIRR